MCISNSDLSACSNRFHLIILQLEKQLLEIRYCSYTRPLEQLKSTKMRISVITVLIVLNSIYSFSQSDHTMLEIKDFKFLIGKWTIANKKLNERLKNSDDWTEFPAYMETKEIMNGLGLMDEFKTAHFGDEFIGLSIRLFDPKSNEWTIYWADTGSPERFLTEQVKGKFENGIGLFYGKEMYNGQEVKLRFIWKKETQDSAQWEQSYFDENKQEWETNWIMTFTKLKE